MKPRIPKQFLGAFKVGHRKPSQEFVDEEYSYELLKRVLDSNYEDKEALEALTYLTRFNNEFHKKYLKKGDPNNLHKSPKHWKDVTDRNNAMERDISSSRRSLMTSTEEPIHRGSKVLKVDKNRRSDPYEDTIIEILDRFHNPSNKKDDDKI